MSASDRSVWTGLIVAAAVGVSAPAASAQSVPDTLPDPDGQPANHNKPVQVYIMMGQSNMLDMGTVSGSTPDTLEGAVANGKYPHLVDENGNWTTRNDVRYVRTQGSGGRGTGPISNTIRNNTDLKPNDDTSGFGVELGFGHVMGHTKDAPVMLLKSAIGNRSLGWDLAPPSTPRRTHVEGGEEYTYARYGEQPLKWKTADGKHDPGHNWVSGLQYDGDVARAKDVLNNIGTYSSSDYQGQGYEIAGFVWWQGDKDRYNAGHAEYYEENMVNFINDIRDEFDAPEAEFVLATLGQTSKDELDTEGELSNDAKILEGQLSVDGEEGDYSEFADNVRTVYSHQYWNEGASNSHYNGDARIYYDVGDALGREMAAMEIPEPGTLALLGLGGAALVGRPRRRRA
jgi:hypothetical protein